MATNTNINPSTPTFANGNTSVNKSDFEQQALGGFQNFFDTYKDNWTGKQQQDVLDQYSAIMKNIDSGNITGRGIDGRFQINNPDNSGINLEHGGAGEVVGKYLSDVLSGMPEQTEQNQNTKQNTDDESGFINPAALPNSVTPPPTTATTAAEDAKDATIKALRDQLLKLSQTKTVKKNNSGLAPGQSRVVSPTSPEGNFWAKRLGAASGRPAGYYTSIKIFADKNGNVKAAGIHKASNPGMPVGGVQPGGIPVILHPGSTAFKFWQNHLAANHNADPSVYHSIYVYKNANGNLVGVGNVAPQGTPGSDFTYENIAQERKQVLAGQQQQQQQKIKDYQTIQAGKRQVFDGNGLTASDVTRLGAIGMDIASAVTAFVGGNFASVATSGASTGMDLAADLSDKSVPLSTTLENLGTNVALTGLSAIPVLGGTAKAAQVGIKLAKFAPKVIAAYSAYKFFNEPGVSQSWKKLIHGDFSKLTVDDLKNYNYTIDFIRSGVGAAKGLKYEKKAAYAKPASQLSRTDKFLSPGAKRMSIEEKKDRMAELKKESDNTLGSGFVKKYNDFAAKYKFIPRYRSDYEMAGIKKAWDKDATVKNEKAARDSWVKEQAKNIRDNIKETFTKKADNTATVQKPVSAPAAKTVIPEVNLTNPDGTPLNGEKTINTTTEKPAEPIQTEKPVEPTQTEKPASENTNTGMKNFISVDGENHEDAKVKAFGESRKNQEVIESSLSDFAKEKGLSIVRKYDKPKSSFLLTDQEDPDDFLLVNKNGKVIYAGHTYYSKTPKDNPSSVKSDYIENHLNDIENKNIQINNQEKASNATKSAVESIKAGVKNKAKTITPGVNSDGTVHTADTPIEANKPAVVAASKHTAYDDLENMHAIYGTINADWDKFRDFVHTEGTKLVKNKDNTFSFIDKDGKTVYKGAIRNNEIGIPSIWVDENQEPVKVTNAQKASNATKQAVNSISEGTMKKAAKTIRKVKKHQDGGMLSYVLEEHEKNKIFKAQQGTKISSVGVNPKEGKWRTLAFPKIQDYLYNNINDNLASWVNYMQGQHASILGNAMKGNFFKNAYKPSDNSVSDYQNQFAGRTNPMKLDMNALVMPQAVKNKYFVVGGNKRTSGDWSTEGYKADNLYGGMTDYRRILGRKQDFQSNPDLVKSFNDKLKAKGYQMYLAPNNYYMLKRTDNTPIPSYTPGQTSPTAPAAKAELGTTPNLEGSKSIVKQFLNKLGGYTDQAMSLGRLMYVNNATRNRTNDYLKSIKPALQQPYTLPSRIQGDYGAQDAYNQAGAALQEKAGRIAGGTSDYGLSAATQLQGAQQAAEEKAKGALANDNAIQQSINKADQIDYQNQQERNAVANKNNELINQNNTLRAGIKATADAGITQNVNSYLMELQKRYQQNKDLKNARQDYLDTIGMGSPVFDPTKDPELTNLKNFYTEAIQNKNYVSANQLYKKIQNIYDMKSKAYKNSFLRNYAQKYNLDYEPSESQSYRNGGQLNGKSPYTSVKYISNLNDNKLFLSGIHKLINNNLKGTKI